MRGGETDDAAAHGPVVATYPFDPDWPEDPERRVYVRCTFVDVGGETPSVLMSDVDADLRDIADEIHGSLLIRPA